MRKFGLRDKIGYMFGDFGNDFFFIYIASFLMLFYTDVVGISAGLVGLIFLGARVWDAFADIFWGRFIDSRPTTEQGKFRPWVLRMFLPLVVFGVLTFTYFPGMNPSMQMLYSFFTYLIWGTLYSTVNIPYGSMASVITSDPVERASLSTFRSVGASLVGVLISFSVPLVIFVNGKPSGSRFTTLAIFFAVGASICYLLNYFMTTERVQAPIGTRQKLDFKVTMKGITQNRALLSIIVAALVLLISSLLGTAMNSYLFKDYFHNIQALTLAGVVSIGSMLIVAPFIGKITKTIGKKEASSVAVLSSAIIYFLMYILPIRNAWVFVGLVFLANLGVGLFNTTIWAFITDIIDYQEYLTGVREEGTIYSFYSFARKIGQALAGGLSGLALAAIGYVSVPKGKPPVIQTDAVAHGIKAFATLTPAICYLVVFLILQFWYPLSKSKLAELQTHLKAKHAAE